MKWDIQLGQLDVPATTFKVCGSHARYAVICRFVSDLSLWPLLRLKTPRPLVLLGNGTLGRRVAPLSVRTHIHKCVHVVSQVKHGLISHVYLPACLLGSCLDPSCVLPQGVFTVCVYARVLLKALLAV